MLALHQIAEAAACNAGVPAYWVGCSCMPKPENIEEDVNPLACLTLLYEESWRSANLLTLLKASVVLDKSYCNKSWHTLKIF